MRALAPLFSTILTLICGTCLTHTHTRARVAVVSTKYGLINTERAADPVVYLNNDDDDDDDDDVDYDTDYYNEYEGYGEYAGMFGYSDYDSDMGCGCPHCLGMADYDMY
jgi:hypothetical protein